MCRDYPQPHAHRSSPLIFTTPTNMKKKASASLLSGLMAVLLVACKAGPNYQPPAQSVADHFAHEQADAYRAEKVEMQWWAQFNDPMLSDLVAETIRNNLDLRVATAHLKEARSLYVLTGLDMLPGVTAHGVYTAQKRSLDALNRRNFVPRNLELFNAGFDATWELDLFGRLRRRVEASSAQMEMTEAERRDLTVTIIAETVRNYLALRGLQTERAVAQKNIANQAEVLHLTETLLEAGKGNQLDTARARELLSVSQAGLPELEMAIEQSIHRLGVLTGQMPDTLSQQLAESRPLPALPQGIGIGQPADLLRRRPDIRIAERNLAAATANIGVVTAELFPRLTFNGNFSLEGRTIMGMGGPGSESFLAGPRLTWAAFDLGRVKTRITIANIETEAALAQYQQTVLGALEDTENALMSFTQQRNRLVALDTAREASLEARNLSQLRFEAGVSDFLVVLDAERRVLDDERQHIRGQTATLTALLSVYKALGGGWEPFEEKL